MIYRKTRQKQEVREERGEELLLLLSHFSRVRHCATPQTAAHQAPPSLGFSRQEHLKAKYTPINWNFFLGGGWVWKNSPVSHLLSFFLSILLFKNWCRNSQLLKLQLSRVGLSRTDLSWPFSAQLRALMRVRGKFMKLSKRQGFQPAIGNPATSSSL